MAQTKNMTGGNPLKLMLTFSIPLMLGNVFQQLYIVVDTAIVGRGVGIDALAALGSVDWLNWMIVGIIQGFTHGFSVRMSQKYGEGDRDGLKHIIGLSVRITVIIAVFCTIVSLAILPLLLDVLRVPSSLQGIASLYTGILFAGIPAVTFYNFCASILRSVGNSKTPLNAMIIASTTNIVLDYVTVFVLGWGITGAAVSTVGSQLLSGIICAVRIGLTPELRFEKHHMRRDMSSEMDLIKIGIPVALQNLIIAVGGMAVQVIVNGFSMTFIAGFTATNKLYGLLDIAAISYGYAVTTYVGQNYGAGKYDRIKRGMRSAIILALITSVVIAAAAFIFGRPLTMLFISSENQQQALSAGNTAYLYLSVMSLFLPILYMLYVYRAAIQGLGNTLVPLLSGIVEFIMRVGIAALIGFTGSENGIFFAEGAAWVGAAALLIISYYFIVRRIYKSNDKKCAID